MQLNRLWATLVLRLVVVVATLTASIAVPAQSLLTLDEAERLALIEEPGHEALLAEADALNEQSVVAGQLPDPQLRIGLGNFPIESGGFTTEGMTQAQLGVRQAFPPGRTRSLSTRRYEQMAGALHRSADGRSRDVITNVRKVWLDTYYWQQAQAIVAESRPHFTDLLTVSQSLYSVGHKDQRDVLQAELELSRLDDRLIEISQQLALARARLSEWVPDTSTDTVGSG